MRSTAVTMLFCALTLLVACGRSAPSQPVEAPAKPPALVRTAQEQVLAVNRLPKTPAGTVPGILVTRAVVAENDGGKWKEVFRCDEHLKNPEGFLSGTPLAPVTGWRLQYEQNAEKGLLLFFTPLEQPRGGHVPAIGVRWNPKVKRYQSLDRNFEQFLGELPALERPTSRLK